MRHTKSGRKGNVKKGKRIILSRRPPSRRGKTQTREERVALTQREEPWPTKKGVSSLNDWRGPRKPDT